MTTFHLTSHHVQARHPSGRAAITARSGLVGASSLANNTSWLSVRDLEQGDPAIEVNTAHLTPAQQDWAAWVIMVEQERLGVMAEHADRPAALIGLTSREVGHHFDRPCSVGGVS